MFNAIRSSAAILLLAAFVSGCATTNYQNLPIRAATVVDSQQSLRKVFTPSAGGAAAGALAGGVVGNQIGKGSGRKVATALGVIGGAAVGGTVAGTEKMVPYSIVYFRDNQSGEVYSANLDGQWQPGMGIRYSITEEGKLVLR